MPFCRDFVSDTRELLPDSRDADAPRVDHPPPGAPTATGFRVELPPVLQLAGRKIPSRGYRPPSHREDRVSKAHVQRTRCRCHGCSKIGKGLGAHRKPRSGVRPSAAKRIGPRAPGPSYFRARGIVRRTSTPLASRAAARLSRYPPTRVPSCGRQWPGDAPLSRPTSPLDAPSKHDADCREPETESRASSLPPWGAGVGWKTNRIANQSRNYPRAPGRRVRVRHYAEPR
jgi:hypothetical protein